MLGATEGAIYDYKRDNNGQLLLDDKGQPQISGLKPYQQYTGQRIAGPDILSQQAYQGIAGLGLGAETGNSLQNMYNMAAQAGTSQYNPTAYGSQYNAPAAYEPGEFTYNKINAAKAEAAELGAAPTAVAERMQAAQLGLAPTMQAASDVGTRSFIQPGATSAYMSPYMQSVVDIQQREAQRQADIAASKRRIGLANAGAFGGGRHAIENAEAARNLAIQKGDIQALGLQSAFQSAQGQFNTEQQAALNAALANQQVMQQARMANQAMQGQYGLTQGQFSQAANAANQQAANQIALANQGMKGQYGLAQAQLSQAANLQNAQLQHQASLANQQAALTVQQQQELANQYGYGQSMASAANAAQYGQAANQLREQANQYGAGYGLQALQAGMQGMQNYGNLSGLYNNQMMNIYNAQNQMGTQAQNYQQQQLTQNYNDFLNQQNFPFQQIGQMSNVLRGVPLTQQTQAVYQQAPSLASQAAGFGTAAIGAANLFKAKGGMIRQPRGLSSLILARMD
jgi:hypothetical protein